MRSAHVWLVGITTALLVALTTFAGSGYIRYPGSGNSDGGSFDPTANQVITGTWGFAQIVDLDAGAVCGGPMSCATVDAGFNNLTAAAISCTSVSCAVSSVGAFGSSPSSAGASISGTVLTLQPADSTHPGGLSTGTQSIAGDKTWLGDAGVAGATTLSGLLTCSTGEVVPGWATKPTITSLTQATGTLGAGAYNYKLTTLSASGESFTSNPVSITITATHGVTIAWTPPAGGTGTNIYGRISGNWLFIATVGAGIGTYTDDGSITPSGSPPTLSSTTSALEISGGSSTDNGIQFDNAFVRMKFSKGQATQDYIYSDGSDLLTPARYHAQRFSHDTGDGLTGTYGSTSAARMFGGGGSTSNQYLGVIFDTAANVTTVGGVIGCFENNAVKKVCVDKDGALKAGTTGVWNGVSAAMFSGTITVSTSAVHTGSIPQLTHAGTGTAANFGVLSVGTITAETSFVINSTNIFDNDTVYWTLQQ